MLKLEEQIPIICKKTVQKLGEQQKLSNKTDEQS